jgi:cytoskeletal protein CcmA (bactofilin family)
MMRIAALAFLLAIVTSVSAEPQTRLVGANVEIDEPVAGNVRAAGARIVVKAPISGNFRAAAGQVVIDSSVGGNVTVAAGALELGPNARINGSLRFTGGSLEQDAGARVAGAIEEVSERHPRWASFGHSGPGRWIWTAGLMLLAAVIAAALPGASDRMAQELRARPWMPPVLGFIALTCIPVAALLVMITIIGIPIGILALLGYAMLLLVGYVCAAVVIGGMLLGRFKAESASLVGWRVGAAVAAMLAIALLARVPFIGGVVVLCALVIGVGLIFAAAFRQASAAPAA